MPVERMVKYSTMVDTLDDALAFVMRYLDEMGAEPSISIKPVWAWGEDDGPESAITQFDVAVSAVIEIKRDHSLEVVPE
jgi:hypothetical protein